MTSDAMTPEQREAKQMELLERWLTRRFPVVPRGRRPDMVTGGSVRVRWSAGARATVAPVSDRD
jgi:hypothetical protein